MPKLNQPSLFNTSNRISNDTIISPIFYMGNKKRIINKGLIDYFPDNINKFIDVFGGSGIVSMNVKAKEVYINDIDMNLNSLYNLFGTIPAKDIINKIDSFISEYHLPTERTKRNVYKNTDKINEYKQAYSALRDYYNSTHDIFAFYTLTMYSFSQQFRFNDKGEFNMPFGNDCYTDTIAERIKEGCKFFSADSTHLSSLDFKEFINSIINQSSGNVTDYFLYLDPPYLITNAVYNERGTNKWTLEQEQELYNILDTLTNLNYKLAMSNVAENKGVVNESLLSYVKSRNYNIHYFDNFNYTTCGKGNSATKEILVTNY